ncbi:MAG: hypothetical protein MJA29_05445, partial [Candidatus Omnitrophica bacterium]|nr:hypothetical protein [Candidatus Omnitrophota bacterium]
FEADVETVTPDMILATIADPNCPGLMKLLQAAAEPEASTSGATIDIRKKTITADDAYDNWEQQVADVEWTPSDKVKKMISEVFKTKAQGYEKLATSAAVASKVICECPNTAIYPLLRTLVQPPIEVHVPPPFLELYGTPLQLPGEKQSKITPETITKAKLDLPSRITTASKKDTTNLIGAVIYYYLQKQFFPHAATIIEVSQLFQVALKTVQRCITGRVHGRKPPTTRKAVAASRPSKRPAPEEEGDDDDDDEEEDDPMVLQSIAPAKSKRTRRK